MEQFFEQQIKSSNVIDCFTGKYRWLSNFETISSGIILDGVFYSSTEHAYQAAKTFNPDERELIRIQPTPAKAKKVGMIVTLRPDWEEVKLQVMYDCLIQKYNNPYYRELLLNTGDAELIENNFWNDTFWGVCGGFGHNYLGKLTMAIRDSLRKGK